MRILSVLVMLVAVCSCSSDKTGFLEIKLGLNPNRDTIAYGTNEPVSVSITIVNQLSTKCSIDYGLFPSLDLKIYFQTDTGLMDYSSVIYRLTRLELKDMEITTPAENMKLGDSLDQIVSQISDVTNKSIIEWHYLRRHNFCLNLDVGESKELRVRIDRVSHRHGRYKVIFLYDPEKDANLNGIDTLFMKYGLRLIEPDTTYKILMSKVSSDTLTFYVE